MDCARTCILVLVVCMFTPRGCEFTQKYQQSDNRFYECIKIEFFFCFKL